MKRMPQSFRWSMVGAGTGVALVVSLLLMSHWHMQRHDVLPVDEFNAATVLPTPRPLPAFSFAATDGTPFDRHRLQQHWTLWFFGFSHCPMMCPTAMKTLAQVYHSLQRFHVHPLPQVVMVTLDPARDDLPRLRNYLSAFDPSFVGAVAAAPQLETITHYFGVVYAKQALPQTKGQQDYTIQHSGAVMVTNPNGDLVAFFNWPLRWEAMVTDYQRLANG